MKVNMNAWCRVRLTATGARIYQESCADMDKLLKRPPKTILPGHILETELWSLMQEFGPRIFHGGEPPFEGNEIEIVKIPEK